MSLQIGRAGVNISLDDPSSWDRSGPNDINIGGDVIVSSVADGLTLSRQLTNLKDGRNELFVPYIHSGLSQSGIVQVQSCDVKSNVLSSVTGNWDFTLKAEKVRYWRRPRVAVLNISVDRSGAGTPAPWTAVPASATAINAPSVTTGFTARSGPTVEGFPTGLYVWDDSAVAGDVFSYQLDPTDWYDGAGWVYDARFDETQAVVVGEQWDWPLTSSALHFGITNGLVRVETGDNSGGLDNAIRTTMPVAATPTSWSTVHQNWGIYVEYPVASGTYNNVGKAPSSVSVLRNSPQEVAVRLVFDVRGVANEPIRVNVDLSLRRGARMCDVICSSPSGSFKYRIKPPGATAFSVAGAHYIQTANDADGNQAAGWTHQTRTAGSPGQMQTTTAGPYSSFSLGGVFGGTAATGIETALLLDNQFDSVGSETVRLVAP